HHPRSPQVAFPVSFMLGQRGVHARHLIGRVKPTPENRRDAIGPWQGDRLPAHRMQKPRVAAGCTLVAVGERWSWTGSGGLYISRQRSLQLCPNVCDMEMKGSA